MKLKPIYLTALFVLLNLFSGCSDEESNDQNEIDNNNYLSIDMKSIYGDFAKVYNNGDNIQADYGYSGTDVLTYFDINILDFSPQTFSIGFIKAVDGENFNFKSKQYNIGSFSLVNNDTPIFSANANIIINEDYENSFWMDTNIEGEGYLKIINDNNLEHFFIEFDFTCYEYNFNSEGATLIAQARIKGGTKVKKRNS